MQLPFDTYPPAVKRENKYLWQALGAQDGNPRYQWAWSNDLMMPMVIMDERSRIVYDTHCACGINVSVHTDERCNWITQRPRWEMRNLAFNLESMWVLVKWIPPEMTREDWEETFGGQPYPQGGYFVPVSDGVKCLRIPSGQVPFRPTSELIVQEIRKHFSKSAKEHAKAISDNWDRLDDKRKQGWIERMKDAFPVHEGFPGKKENWSHGGLGESPALVKESQCPQA